jgi:hypothetical protein
VSIGGIGEEGLRRAVVRVVDRGRSIVGTGFSVTGDLVVTCAHVVREALRKTDLTVSIDGGEEVEIQLAGMPEGQDFVSATVEGETFRDSDADDVAFLRLKTPLSDGIQPLVLATSEGTDGRELRGWGFPKVGRDGLWMTGTVVGPLGDGGKRFQLRSTNISPGCSGGPLWDERGRVVGMVVAIVDRDTKTGRHGDTAFAIASELLAGVCRELSLDRGRRGTGEAALAAAQALARPSGVPALPPYLLTLTDYQSATRWRWILSDGNGNCVADAEVELDAGAIEHRGFRDLPAYLRDFSVTRTERDLLHEVGAWAGQHVFGGLASTLRARRPAPATPIRMVIPAAAQDLVFRPFELAHLDGKSFAERGIRFVYQIAPSHEVQAKGGGAVLRVLGIFSLPSGARPLGLRRERREITRVLRTVAETQGAAVELRVLQYGATRETLVAALEDGDGWDIVHFSGHGLAGEVVLEDARGAVDIIDASDLLPLLLPSRARISLITLSCCFSAAATMASARAAVSLDPPTRTWEAEGAVATTLPSVAQALASGLDCAVLAMRYPVEDGFATRLVTGLFERMLGKKRSLPDALQLALEAAGSDSALSLVTPVLVGGRAADLKLVPPPALPDFALPAVGLFEFPPEPEHFVGRLKPMLEASGALAPEGAHRGVLFYGMAGAGKTSCALELAYRHERGRFTGYVWYQAPNEGDDIGTALASFLDAMEDQLNIEKGALLANLADPDAFKKRTLPRLKGLLQARAVLIAIDNAEGLLTSSNGWRDLLWGDVMATLLDHGGRSRVVLTSRRIPASLERHPRLVHAPMHALSLPESVVLARELPNLSRLFATSEGRFLLRRALQAAQGHPKLIDLADGLAADPAALERHLATSATPGGVAAVEGAGAAARFFAVGETAFEDDAFVATLKQWANDIGANLPAEARLALAFLCRVEDADRVQGIVEDNWKDLLERLTGARGAKDDGGGRVREETRALAERLLLMPGMGFEAAVEALDTSGLLERVERIPLEGADPEKERQRRAYRIHPAIAEATLDKMEAALQAMIDVQLGDLWLLMVRHGLDNEMEGGGTMIVEGGKHAGNRSRGSGLDAICDHM